MFDRKSIKEFARFRLSQRRLIVIVVLLIAGLLGGAVATPSLPSLNVTGTLPTDSIFSEDYTDDSTDTDSGTVWDDAHPLDPEIEAIDPDAENSDPNAADPGIWDDAGSESGFPESWEEFKDFFRNDSDHANFINIFLAIFGVVFTFALVLALLKTVFLGNIVTVGMNGWLLRFWRGENLSVLDLFASFRIYKPALKAMFVSQLYTFLWSLLFFIPGVIKAYAYMMVPYIIYENPNLTPNQAVALSEKLTRGYKWKLFVLELSFIGWNLLSAVTFGIVGLVYVNPYMGLTYAGAYEQIKWAALQDGRITWADFGQMPPAEMWEPAEPIVVDPISEESV